MAARPEGGTLSQNRQYELVYLITPDATEEQVSDVHTQVVAIIERLGGTLVSTEPWGRRRLAYEIGRHKEAIYALEVLSGSGELVKELDRRLRVTDDVLRHLIVRVDEEQRVADRAREKRRAFTARRRVARGLPPEDTGPRVRTDEGESGEELGREESED
jgi:small subunit ribosomal protein S6